MRVRLPTWLHKANKTRSVLRCVQQHGRRLAAHLGAAQPLNDLVAAQVRSLAGVRYRARHPIRVHGAAPNPRRGTVAPCGSSRKCQVLPRGRRRRHRRLPLRTRPYLIKSRLPSGFANACDHMLLSLSRADEKPASPRYVPISTSARTEEHRGQRGNP